MSDLSALPQWADAMAQLRHRYEQEKERAHSDAAEYAARYDGQRAVMVFDVVASRQRKYARVRSMVDAFSAQPEAVSLRDLAAAGPGDQHGFRKGEAITMQRVASGLLEFAQGDGLDDDEASLRWAEWVRPFEHAPSLDPYVGSVSGIGLALFAYLRMRSGADALKPDVRVRNALNELGFRVPKNGHAVLLVSRAAAQELGVELLVLDQLLWRVDGKSPAVAER